MSKTPNDVVAEWLRMLDQRHVKIGDHVLSIDECKLAVEVLQAVGADIAALEIEAT